MLVTVNAQQSIWEAILPPEALRLPDDLERVDALLDDSAFFDPYFKHFSLFYGRPSIPMETYIRLMFLKFKYRLSYEVLCSEVSDSLSWRRFCRISLDGRVPHPTTLIKITGRCNGAVEELNEILLAKAAEKKVIRLDKVRVDSTVVEANVSYPNDAGLLAKSVKRINRLIERIHDAGGAPRTKIRNRSRSAGRRVRSLLSKIKGRTEEAKNRVRSINAELVDIAVTTANDAEAILRNTRRQLQKAGPFATAKLRSLVDDLEVTISRTHKIAEQTTKRINGETVEGATRLVSLHDPDARPIVKGRLGKPVEFGYKAQVVDNADGIVIDHSVHIGNPNDAGLLLPSIKRIAKRFNKVPKDVTADRGYEDSNVEAELIAIGVKNVVIPKKGKITPERRELQNTRKFKRLVKWRTGIEGRISVLKNSYEMDRTMMDGHAGAQSWCGLSILCHNAIKIGRLVEEKEQRDVKRSATRKHNATAKQSKAPPNNNQNRAA